jgi:ribosomal protein S28E/S33
VQRSTSGRAAVGVAGEGRSCGELSVPLCLANAAWASASLGQLGGVLLTALSEVSRVKILRQIGSGGGCCQCSVGIRDPRPVGRAVVRDIGGGIAVADPPPGWQRRQMLSSQHGHLRL